MIVVELDQIEIDHCIHCAGSWLDAGELELLLGGAGNRDDLLSRIAGEAPVKEAPRRCPICDKKMQKVACRLDDGDIVLDRCARNDGLWFDRGELAGVLRYGDFPHGHDIYKLLNEIFGEYR
jgi:Zn-finger nucleic acid-binding protein